MRLAELHPRLSPMSGPDEWGTQFLAFRCPKCLEHEISIYIWSGPAIEQKRQYPEVTLTQRVWHAEQGPHRDWDTLTVTPSVNREGCGDKCGGWHGFITNGEVR